MDWLWGRHLSPTLKVLMWMHQRKVYDVEVQANKDTEACIDSMKNT